VDGVPRGRGVVVLGEITPKVPHRVEVRMAGLAPVVRTVTVQPGQSETVRVNLTALLPKGDILFLGDMRRLVLARDSRVLVDGREARVEQGLVRDITPGQRQITVTRREFPQLGAVAGVPRDTVLWERNVKISPGSAVSFNSDDLPENLRRQQTAAATGTTTGTSTAAAAEPPAANIVRLRLTLLDSAGRSFSAADAIVSFDGEVLRPLKTGAWPLPVGRAGVLRVEASGHVAEERRLRYRAAGESYITCVLRPTAVTALREWRTRVKSVSAEHGLLVLGNIPGQPVKPGQHLSLTPLSRELRIRLVVASVKGTSVVCQLAPGQGGIVLPKPEADALVSLLPP
jgi:hypothetical protein